MAVSQMSGRKIRLRKYTRWLPGFLTLYAFGSNAKRGDAESRKESKLHDSEKRVSLAGLYHPMQSLGGCRESRGR
jgi:hypothetical protein